MADVFMSYVRNDKERVTRLVEVLRGEGFDVWWDDDILPDLPWEQTIEQALFAAKAVVVCWSGRAIASDNVRSEARWARTNGQLLQVFLDRCDPPLFFGERQGIDVSRWNGKRDAAEIARLSAKLREMVALAPQPIAKAPPHVHRVSGEKPRRRRRAWGAVAAAILAITVVSAFFVHRGGAGARGTRIAVLPLDVPAGDAGAGTFASALTDQIVTGLNSSEMPALSRADALALRGIDNVDRLKSLGVALLFDGSVQNDGKTMTVQVHVSDPQQHAVVWSGSDKADLKDLDALRGRVTRTVVGVLACSNRALKANGLTDPILLGRYLRACDLFVNDGDASGPTMTFELLDNLRIVTQQAPDFVAARTDLAKFEAYLAPLMPPDQAATMRAESAAQAASALALEPKSPDAYLAQAMLLPPTAWAKREALLRQGVAIDPSWPHTNGFLAQFLTETGRVQEATVYGAHAAAADLQIDWGPYDASLACDAGNTADTIIALKAREAAGTANDESRSSLRQCLMDAGRFVELRALRGIPVAEPADGPVTHDSVAAAFDTAMISHAEQDIASAHRQAMSLASTETSSEGLQGIIVKLAQLGFVDDAFAVARRYRPGYPTTGLVAFMFGPRTAALRRDPRFLSVMAGYGLTDFWRMTGRWPDFCAEPGLPYNCRSEVARLHR